MDLFRKHTQKWTQRINSNIYPQALGEACYYGWTSKVEKMLANEINDEFINLECEFSDTQGQLIIGTPLILAAYRQNYDIIPLLLDKNADPNIQHSMIGNTALHLASRRGDEMSAVLLLQNGADPNIVDKRGETPISCAATNGHFGIYIILLEFGANSENALDALNSDGKGLLHHAASHGDLQFVTMALEGGADPNSQDKARRTPFHCAVTQASLPVVNLLLARGADPNIIDNTGKSALHFAARDGSYEIMALLLNRCNLNLVDINGSSPLSYAYQYHHIDIARLLLENGADPNYGSMIGGKTSILQWAVRLGDDPITLYLLEKKANPNTVDKLGISPLCDAAGMGNWEIAQLLLKYGANPFLGKKNEKHCFDLLLQQFQNQIVEFFYENRESVKPQNMRQEQMVLNPVENGQPWLHGACEDGKKLVVKMLLDVFQFNPNQIDSSWRTPLFYAAANGSEEIVTTLLDHGADPNRRDKSLKHTPLIMACMHGHQNIVAILLAHGAEIYYKHDETLQNPFDVAVGREPILQLLRIYDYFQKRKMEKKVDLDTAPSSKIDNELKAIVHDMVRYPHLVDEFRTVFHENADIIKHKDKEGRTVRQVACKACREVILFMGRYEMEEKPRYESATCVVFFALDWGGDEYDENQAQEATPVAMKFFAQEKHFNREMQYRRETDGTPRFSFDYVAKDLSAYTHKDKRFSESCKNWTKTGKPAIPDYCVVLERGDRSLLEVLSAENLSTKEFDTRAVLLKLCEALLHLHQTGFVHGDIKPRNYLRLPGGGNAWKLIDFDACVKIGDVIGQKLSSGFAPAEILNESETVTSDERIETVFEILSPESFSAEKCLRAEPSFDVWSFGMTMYNLVTGQSFFHCDDRDNLVNLSDLANLTDTVIQRRLELVKDAKARILLSGILKRDPKKRTTMENIRKDVYFNPSDMLHGRQAESLGRRRRGQEASQESLHRNPSQLTIAAEMDTERNNNAAMDIEQYVHAGGSFSYFDRLDDDKDWNDKLFQSEIETFDFEDLRSMGEKPILIDGNAICSNKFLNQLVCARGPDYFFGCLVDFFELYEIMDEAEHICEKIGANLVRDVKGLKGILVKLFVRGKGLNDAVRGTLFCDSIREFEFVAEQLESKYNVYIKGPKKGPGAFSIPKLLVSSRNRRIDGKCMTVEIQFSTVYFHLVHQVSQNHLVYEAIRESTCYLTQKKDDKEFRKLLNNLNRDFPYTQGFMESHHQKENGYFDVLFKPEEIDKGMDGTLTTSDMLSLYSRRPTGLIFSGSVACCGRHFQFMAPPGYMKRFSPPSFVVDNSLTLLSRHSYWTEQAYSLEGKTVEFVASFKDRGAVIVGIGSKRCLESEEGKVGGSCFSLYASRLKLMVRSNGAVSKSTNYDLPDQKEAIFRLEIQNGKLSVSIKASGGTIICYDGINEGKLESSKLFHLFMRAPPGFHDVKYHSVDIRC